MIFLKEEKDKVLPCRKGRKENGGRQRGGVQNERKEKKYAGRGVETVKEPDMAKVRVFDIRGRLLLEKKDINASETKVNVGTTNEVLLVEVTTTEGLKATKRVIN